MESTVKELRDWAMRADNNKFFKRATSIQIKLDKLERIEKPKFERKNMKLDLKAAERSGNETIKAKGLCKSFREKEIFKQAELLVNYGERVALIGANGCGKTTFIKMLLGEESSDSGSVELGANVKLAYLPQNIQFPNEELTLLECFRENIVILEGKAREYLSKYMFFGKSVFKKVKQLSGGEKIRLKLSMLLYDDVNLLILDEPTNHLDIASIETLEAALEEFKGTIFFISHDRYFINKIGERVVAIENKAFKTYLGNYNYYKSKQEEAKLELEEEQIPKKEKLKKAKAVEDNKKWEAERLKLEASIDFMEKQLKEIEEAMNQAGENYEELKELLSQKEKLGKKLEYAMEDWLQYDM